jgi:hypothetical protein
MRVMGGPLDPAAVFGDALFERVEVERLERAVGAELAGVVADQEMALQNVDIGFDTAKTLLERVRQGMGVFVIVVGMGSSEGARRRGVVVRS